MAIAIRRLDHLVLTVRDLEASTRFYVDVLGMRDVRFGDGRRAVAFGDQKINLHLAGHEIAPHAEVPAPGSADLCLLTDTPVDEAAAQLAAAGVEIALGPAPRAGATGPIVSVYLRDPDGNLIELANPV